MTGRVLVATFGFFSMLLFGGILASSGSVVAMMYDDFVKKIRWPALARPFWSSIFWGIITAMMTIYLGALAQNWWEWRLEPEDVPSPNDAAWFAYLSTTTIGLGDYYFQPEVIFMGDAFTFAFLFLAAFVYYAAFLTRLSDFILGEFPDAGEIFRIRLEETSLLGIIPRKLCEGIRTRIVRRPNDSMEAEASAETSGDEEEEEEDADPYGGNDAILDLIVQYAKSERRTFEVVQREEELLVELLERVRKERIKLQILMPRATMKRQARSRQLMDQLEAVSTDYFSTNAEVPEPTKES
jgi:hypothetical protein